jgi:hypothetical protein
LQSRRIILGEARPQAHTVGRKKFKRIELHDPLAAPVPMFVLAEVVGALAGIAVLWAGC